MAIEKKIQRTTTIIIILSSLVVGLKYLGLWIEGFTGMFLVLFAGLAGLILLVLLGVRIVTILKTRERIHIIPVVIGVIAIIIYVFTPIEKIIEKIKSPVVLACYCEHTVTTVSLILRADKSFDYNAGAFLSKEIYHGNYHLNHDTLILNYVDKNPGNVSNQLIFTEKSLIEIGDTTIHRHHFKITLDNLTR